MTARPVPVHAGVPINVCRTNRLLLWALAAAGCSPRSAPLARACYEVRSRIDSTGFGALGVTKLVRRDSMARPTTDTFEFDPVEVWPGALPPGRFDLPDSFPWYRVRSPTGSTAVSIVWRSEGASILIDTHNGFTGGLFRLARRHHTIAGGGVWTSDDGQAAYVSLALIPLANSCGAGR
jgi:hypothetical protein